MIFVTGDIHGPLSVNRLFCKEAYPDNKLPKEEDYVIILGDFGLIWDANCSGPKEARTLY